MIIPKSQEQIELIAIAGAIHAECLSMLAGKVRAGVSTRELSIAAGRFISARGATATFEGYRGFPAAICASPGSVVVHGIPNRDPLITGDIISLDIGVTYQGWIADGAITLAIGDVAPEIRKLINVTEASLDAGIEQCVVGNRIGDISAAIGEIIEASGLYVIRNLSGHGVGQSLHEEPDVPNQGRRGAGPKLQEGMVLAIEPMVSIGTGDIRVASDGWAISTADDSASAHFERTIAITTEGPRVLTPWTLLEATAP